MAKKKPDGRNLVYSYTFYYNGERITEETSGSSLKQAQWSMKQRILKIYHLDLGDPYKLQLTFVRDKNKTPSPFASLQTTQDEKLVPQSKPIKKPRVEKDKNSHLPLFDGWPPAGDE